MNYRLLKPEEFYDVRFLAFCGRNDLPVTNPQNSLVAVAEKDGKILYCHMAHLQLHLDNQCRDKDYHGFIDFRKVYQELENVLPKPAVIYTYPSYSNGVRMAEICGFHKADFPTMIKEVR